MHPSHCCCWHLKVERAHTTECLMCLCIRNAMIKTMKQTNIHPHACSYKPLTRMHMSYLIILTLCMTSNASVESMGTYFFDSLRNLCFISWTSIDLSLVFLALISDHSLRQTTLTSRKIASVHKTFARILPPIYILCDTHDALVYYLLRYRNTF